VLLTLIAPATGEPISTFVLSVVWTITSLLAGGASAATASAINKLWDAAKMLRDAIITLADNIARAIGRVARWADAAVRGLRYIWSAIIRPILNAIQKFFDRLGKLIDKVLKPYLDFMNKIRRQIMQIYNIYFRPIIQVIETMRRMLAILRLAHIKWADKLDARLARLEAKVMWPIREMLKRTNTLPGWFNVLLTAKYLLQYPIFINSMVAYDGAWINHFYNAQSKTWKPEDRAALEAETPEVTPAMAAQQLREYFTTGGGPLAEDIMEALADFRQQVGS
jgi:hypothetical protein